jgi:phospholipase C
MAVAMICSMVAAAAVAMNLAMAAAVQATPVTTIPLGSQPTTVVPDDVTSTPIKHFVYMMQGDRSFDNYFGTYPEASGIPAGTCQAIVLTRPSDGCVKPFALHGSVPPTLGGGKVELDNQYNNGAMNGFVAAYQAEGRDGSSAMGHYDQRDLATYWNLAEQYVLFDQFFSSTRAGVLSNRSFWVSAVNDPTGTARQKEATYANQATIFDLLQSAKISWKFYVQGYDPKQTFRTASKTSPTSQPVRVPLLNYGRFVDNPALKSHIVDLSQYSRDLDAGTLPAVAYIASNGPSERSARSIASGQAVVSQLVTDLMLSKYWNNSAFLLSYDGSGGWFDHVKPPQVDRYGYGIRVPGLLISSYARPGYVDHTTFDYTSALVFIERNWHLRSLASRDSAASSIADAFDFASGPRAARVSFASVAVAAPRTTRGSVAVVFWCYGAALTFVLLLFSFVLLQPALRPRWPRKPVSESIGFEKTEVQQ